MRNRSILPIGVTKGFKPSHDDTASSSRAFAGTFDGCGHTISNYHCAFMSNASLPYGGGVGLFGNVERAKILNLKLHAEVSADSSVGALVGYVGDLTTISNCQVTASVTGRSDSWGRTSADSSVESGAVASKFPIARLRVLSAVVRWGLHRRA